MLVAVAVIGILSSIVLRTGLEELNDERSRTGVRSMAAWLEEVRQRAISESVSCQIQVLPAEGRLEPAASNRCGSFPAYDLRSSTGSDAIRLCAAAVAADAPAPACPGAAAQLTLLFTPRGTSTTDALLRVQMPGYSPDHCVQLIRPLGVLRTGRVVAGVCNWSQPV
jgi:Tfp pilus assembly protein FimT